MRIEGKLSCIRLLVALLLLMGVQMFAQAGADSSREASRQAPTNRSDVCPVILSSLPSHPSGGVQFLSGESECSLGRLGRRRGCSLNVSARCWSDLED